MTPTQAKAIYEYEKQVRTMRARARMISKFNLAADLNYCLTRVAGDGGKNLMLDEVMNTALNASDADKLAMIQLLDGARNKDNECITALQELRREDIELFVRAQSNFGLFFTPKTLADSEQAVYVHTYKNPTNVKFIGQDGHIGTQKAVKSQKQVYVDMREISAEVGYQIRDVNLGTDIVAAANATVDVAWEVNNKIDYEAFKLLINGGIFGPFTMGTPGSSTALNATFIPHWRIQTANLPTTNNISLAAGTAVVNKLGLVANGTSTGQSNLFRFDAIQAVVDYCESFGDIFGKKMSPTGAIIVPSSDVSGMTASVKPLTLFFNEIAEDVLKDYSAFEYLKHNWVMIPDATLSPGCCYFVLNEPLGDKLTKPSLDWDDVDTNRKKNWETRTTNKTLQYFVAERNRPNIVRVIYSSTYTDPTLN